MGIGSSIQAVVSDDMERAHGAMLKPSQKGSLEVALRKANHMITFAPWEDQGSKQVDTEGTFVIKSSSRNVYAGDFADQKGEMENEKPILSLEVVEDCGRRTLLVRDPATQGLRMMLCVDGNTDMEAEAEEAVRCNCLPSAAQKRPPPQQEVPAAAVLYSNDMRCATLFGHNKGVNSEFLMDVMKRGTEQTKAMIPILAVSNWGPFGRPGGIKYFRRDMGKIVGSKETWVADHTSVNRTPGLGKISTLKIDPASPVDPISLIVLVWYVAIVVVDEVLAGNSKSFSFSMAEAHKPT